MLCDGFLAIRAAIAENVGSWLFAEPLMLPFKLIYGENYRLPIGEHVFPSNKYNLIYKKLVESGVADSSDFLAPTPASDADVLLVHTPMYVHKLKTGTLSARE